METGCSSEIVSIIPTIAIGVNAEGGGPFFTMSDRP